MSELELRFQELAADWRSATGLRSRPLPDDRLFGLLRAEADAIRAAGRWVSGPEDLLSVLGKHRDELFHSRLLAWLLRPSGMHGFGDRFVRAFLAEALPGTRIATAAVQIATELERTATSGLTGLPVQSRADLVVTLDGLVVVVENKLDAGEGPDQCERLYWCWAGEGIETRYVFLSPSGRVPITTVSDDARAAWRPMRYRQVRSALERTLDDTRFRAADLGRATAMQYLATLIANES